ncbi:MAG: FecR domain-containing protein, partial [Candidatus Solibacter usitatus]|nr:FecR domain-containing protein [Candidatus Solibacter usitatus]
MRLNRFAMRWLIAPMLLTGSVAAFADDNDTDAKRGVARISHMNGDVSVRRGDSGEWLAASPNAPLVAGDHVQTGPGTRTEVQFDYSNMLRLSANGEIGFPEMEQGRYMVQMASGLAMFRVLREMTADVEVSTPNASLRPMKKGMYRIAVHADGTTEFTVRSGEADIYTQHGSQRLRSGKTMLVRGTAADPEFQVVGAVMRDGWDQWNEERDNGLMKSNAYRYVSSSVYGAEDLDAHGSW